MAFNADNLTMLSNVGTDQTPNIFGYYSSTDTIDVILSTLNYFSSFINPQLSANANQQLFNSGDIIYITDANGNSYQLVFSINTANSTVSLISGNATLLQSKITTLSAPQTIYDLPPAGYIAKIQAVLDAQISGTSSVITISQGANTIATITVAAADVAGTIYTPTLTSTTAYKLFNGATPLKIASTGLSTGTSALKILTSIVASAR